jgi:hypothetical protein
LDVFFSSQKQVVEVGLDKVYSFTTTLFATVHYSPFSFLAFCVQHNTIFKKTQVVEVGLDKVYSFTTREVPAELQGVSFRIFPDMKEVRAYVFFFVSICAVLNR